MTLDTVLSQLDTLARGQPDLRAAAELQREIVLCQHRPAAPGPAWSPHPDEARQRLMRGAPLLPGHERVFDLAHAEGVFYRLLKLVEKRPPTKAEARALQQAARTRLTAREWLESALAVDGGIVAAATERLDAPLLPSLLRWSLAPTLQAWVNASLPRLSLDLWEQGYCPVCAEWPALGELRGVELGRRLRCGWCGADWRAPRLRCPFCHNAEAKTLGYFTVEGEPRWRVEYCDECRGYVKTLTTFGYQPILALTADDVASLPLDVLAGERGLTRPTGRADSGRLDAERGDLPGLTMV